MSLIDLINTHLDQYVAKKYPLIVKLIIYRKLGESYLFYGRIRPQFPDDNVNKEKLEYDNFLYIQELIQPKDFTKIQCFITPLSTTMDNIRTYRYNDITFISPSHEPMTKEKPVSAWLKGFNFHSKCRTILRKRFPSPSISGYEELISKNLELPNYPTIRDLIKDKFGFDTQKYSVNQELHLALTPLEGQISGVDLKEGELYINISCEHSNSLTLKIFGLKDTETYTKNINVTKSLSIKLPTSYFQYNFKLYNNSGLVIDQQTYSYEKKPPSEDETLLMILNGENQEIEFKDWKKEADKPNSKKYTKLICALANTEGGTILFGVDDNANPTGILKEDIDKIDQFLQNICHTNTNPRVIIEKDSVTIDDKIIGRFFVKKSKKLIQSNDERYYIRRGSTNRTMKPDEIEEKVKSYC